MSTMVDMGVYYGRHGTLQDLLPWARQTYIRMPCCFFFFSVVNVSNPFQVGRDRVCSNQLSD